MADENANSNIILEKLEELENRLASLEDRSEQFGNDVRCMRSSFEEIKALSGADSPKSAHTSPVKSNPTVINAAVPQPQAVQAPLQAPPAGPVKTASPRRTPKQAGERRNLEQFIGRNAMGIGASVLVFIAMVMFATLLMPYIGQELKLAAMYIFSFVLIGLGEWVYRKQKNAYIILSACGAGALFISIVSTRMLFRFIDNMMLYILILIWIGYISYLGKKRNLLFVIVGQIGIVVSMIIASIGMFIPADMYQSFGFLMIAEILFYALFRKADYKSMTANSVGVFLSLITFDIGVYNRVLGYWVESKTPGIALLFSGIVIMGFVALRQLQISDSDKKLNASGIICLAGSIIVGAACQMCGQTTDWCYVPLTIYLAAILSGLTKMQRKYERKTSILSYICFGLMLISILLWPTFITPYVTAAMLLALVAYNFKADRRDIYYLSQSVAILGIETIATERVIAVALLMPALSIAQMAYFKKKAPDRRDTAYEIISYLSVIVFMMLVVDLISFKVWTGSEFMKYIATVSLFIVIQILARESDWMDCDSGKLKVFHFANLAMMIYALSGFTMSFAIPELIFYSALTAGLFSINLLQLLEIKEIFGAYIAVKYTVLAGMIMYSAEAVSYVYSIVFLTMAIAAIVFGFKIINKSSRLYGLVLSMLSIAKLILVDISYTNTLTRAVSFLVCGLLCFGISLIYNHIDKQQKLKSMQVTDEGEGDITI